MIERDSSNTVSVIIPFFSGVEWLDEALESVMNQTLPLDEVIVVNDGSKENISILEKKYKGKVSFIYQENKGAASARNKGIQVSKGRYIAFLDSDDLWLPEKNEIQLKYMIDNGLNWSHCLYSVFDDGTREIMYDVNNSDTAGNMFPKLLARCKIGTPCVMIRRECLIDDRMLFNEKMRQGQDYCFWNILAKRNELGNVGIPLVLVRNHTTNVAKNVFAQLKTKSMMYKYLVEKKDYFGNIPIMLELGFYLSSIGYCFCEKIHNKTLQKYISYLFYLIPWIIFHLFYRFS